MSIIVENLSCHRGERMVFRNLSFALYPGAGLWLRGPNGAGKSTLLRVLAGLLRPLAGTVRLNGVDLEAGDARARRAIAWLGHQDALKPGETAAEAVAFRAALRGAVPDLAALAAMGMDAHAATRIRHLSAGQKRRVALAGAMGMGAPLWLFDEPATALDEAGAALFHACLARHLASGGAAVIATHGAPPPLPGMAELALGGQGS